MSLQATIWGWEQRNISSTEKIVLLDLCDRANVNNVCWPKQKTIAARTRLTERTVCSALAKLESLKLIHRRPRVVNRTRTSDWITLLIHPPAPPPTTTPPAAARRRPPRRRPPRRRPPRSWPPRHWPVRLLRMILPAPR
ncbi:DNA-binding transcriptional MocR family regulator [Bradyrhizobium sp. GM7.3]